jgi:hypothetical protein
MRCLENAAWTLPIHLFQSLRAAFAVLSIPGRNMPARRSVQTSGLTLFVTGRTKVGTFTSCGAEIRPKTVRFLADWAWHGT